MGLSLKSMVLITPATYPLDRVRRQMQLDGFSPHAEHPPLVYLRRLLS
jgi:hypothetical protein